ncbi:hypothetical protein KCU71_g167, partial [Aureobasidium melanogenum]
MLQDNLDAVGNDGGASNPDSSGSILNTGWLLLDERNCRRSGLVDCMICHLLLHLNINKDLAFLVTAAIGDTRLEQVSLETVVNVLESVLVNVVRVVEKSLSLQGLEKGKVARTVSCMQVVADEGDALLPVQVSTCAERLSNKLEKRKSISRRCSRDDRNSCSALYRFFSQHTTTEMLSVAASKFWFIASSMMLSAMPRSRTYRPPLHKSSLSRSCLRRLIKFHSSLREDGDCESGYRDLLAPLVAFITIHRTPLLLSTPIYQSFSIPTFGMPIWSRLCQPADVHVTTFQHGYTYSLTYNRPHNAILCFWIFIRSIEWVRQSALDGPFSLKVCGRLLGRDSGVRRRV